MPGKIAAIVTVRGLWLLYRLSKIGSRYDNFPPGPPTVHIFGLAGIDGSEGCPSPVSKMGTAIRTRLLADLRNESDNYAIVRPSDQRRAGAEKCDTQFLAVFGKRRETMEQQWEDAKKSLDEEDQFSKNPS
ncbi:hypothetical protein CC80DRAFT_591251 [Byssothecium circinans]|uniref:Uncharacterized protein n=1 Tax=Byssothecium circinans TaxID=147558 RepID=A0A6A5U2U7_9PLEO|nr:hypothetical protein CC80DRAFT_591251 [Byssothecium circinans]